MTNLDRADMHTIFYEENNAISGKLRAKGFDDAAAVYAQAAEDHRRTAKRLRERERLGKV